MPPLNFIWFTWSADAACLMESVASVRSAAPDARLHVRFDPDHPLCPAVVWHLTSAGVAVRPSHTPHGGNLNGAFHVLAQLAEIEAAAGTEDGWTVKIDSDVILQRLDWLAPAAETEVQAIGWNAGQNAPWAGPCYALRGGMARHLRDTLAALLQAPRDDSGPTLFLPPGMPEDATIYRLMQATRAPGVVRWPAWPARGFAGFQYPPDTTPDTLPTAARATFGDYAGEQIISFGNRLQLPQPEALHRRLVAETMADYRAA